MDDALSDRLKEMAKEFDQMLEEVPPGKPDLRKPQPMAYDIRRECDEICEFLIAKNEAYGNSVGNPVCVFSKATPKERMGVRMDDKLSRIVNGCEYPGDDTWLDLIGYLILQRVLTKRGEL